MTDVLATITML